MRRRLRRPVAFVLAALAVTALAACEEAEDPAEPGAPVVLRFGVWGSDDELAGYQEVVDSYNAAAVDTRVELVAYDDSASLTGSLAAGAAPPDVYLAARHDLPALVSGDRNEPLFDLLEARDVSYGDDYAQPAIAAFSSDDDLQCMPYSVSPMVVYYNTDLVDFDAMRERGLPAPDEDEEVEGWTFEQFEAAARFASRRGGTRGISLEPRLRSLAPFVYSGGGQLFDDAGSPTSLALSSGENVDTLTTLVGLLRDPDVTLSSDQLAEASPRQWFERGRLAMMEGFRDLTPELRDVEGLDFDVMPMPTIGGPATVGELSGLCLTPGDRVQQAADFLVHAISDESVAPVAEAGRIVPANLTVARSEAFLQPPEQPEHAAVFNASVDSLVQLPTIEDAPALDAVVDPLLDELLNAPVLLDLPGLTAEIDETSRAVLDPDYEPSPADPSS